jgi:hypothetical protein
VAEHADWPVNEADLHARHRWLVAQDEFRRRMKREPKFFDAQVAGWWVWGLCQWIGGGWCAAANWDALVHRPRGTHTREEARRPARLAMGVHTKMPKPIAARPHACSRLPTGRAEPTLGEQPSGCSVARCKRPRAPVGRCRSPEAVEPESTGVEYSKARLSGRSARCSRTVAEVDTSAPR